MGKDGSTDGNAAVVTSAEADEAEAYTVVYSYPFDVAGRVLTATTADGRLTERSYDLAGRLATVDVGTQEVVAAVGYNARGQRLSITYGNGTSTTYAYDPKTFRLTRATTARSSDSAVLADFRYSYDPVGNVVHLRDDGEENGFFDNGVDEPEWDWTYDPTYRLVRATGREWAVDDATPVPDWIADGKFQHGGLPSSSDKRKYIQKFEYDAVGNLTLLTHRNSGDSDTWWRRAYNYDTASNRLVSDTVGVLTSSYAHDAAGNMVQMPHLSGLAVDGDAPAVAGLQWNHANQLVQTYGSNVCVTRYTYDAAGQRVRKVFGALAWDDEEDQWVFSPKKETLYLPGGCEVLRSFDGAGAVLTEWQQLSVQDDRACVVRVECKTVELGEAVTSPTSIWRYQVENQLGSGCLELGDDGQVLSREEYYAYGGTSYAWRSSGFAGSVKRYRYSGKECDSENGLYYFGARYYAAWLGRWTAGDPVFHAGRSSFEYCSGNPVSRVDPDGRDDQSYMRKPIEMTFADGPMSVAPQLDGGMSIDSQAEVQVKAASRPRQFTDVSKELAEQSVRVARAARGDLFLEEIVPPFKEQVAAMQAEQQDTRAVLVSSRFGDGVVMQAREVRGFQATEQARVNQEMLGYIAGGPVGATAATLGGLQAGRAGALVDQSMAALGSAQQSLTRGAESKIISAWIVPPPPPSLKEQAAALVSLNSGKARVEIRTQHEMLRLDLTGTAHRGVETPHMKVSPRNPHGQNQPAYNTSEKASPVVSATQEAIRTVRKYLERKSRDW